MYIGGKWHGETDFSIHNPFSMALRRQKRVVGNKICQYEYPQLALHISVENFLLKDHLTTNNKRLRNYIMIMRSL